MTDPLDAQERAPTPKDRMWFIFGEVGSCLGPKERDFVTEQIRQAEIEATKITPKMIEACAKHLQGYGQLDLSRDQALLMADEILIAALGAK